MFEVWYEQVVDDRKIIDGPGYLWGGCIGATGGGNTQVAIYDGDNANGRLMLDFHATTNTGTPVMFPFPLRFERGLYVDVGSNVDHFIVYYTLIPDPPGDRGAQMMQGYNPAGPMMQKS